MTMTSVAVAPGSLGAPPAMLTPKRYHLQPGLSQNSSSTTPVKNYDTLSKGKKSWSVRLGLSRQSHRSADETTKGWGTISGGSALSRQMLYGDPWLYGTVRSSRGIHDPRGYLNPPPPPPPGAPVLIVCSCPEFLIGTTRKLGNCRKCGGHRLAGVPLGGTCRMATTSTRTRPSLAGILRSSVDDPYDLMRRSRLVEPRSRARSTSPHRQSNQRDSRCQMSTARPGKERKTATTEVPVSRTEWFDNEMSTIPSYEDNTRKSRPSFAGASSDDWHEEISPEDTRNSNGRVVRIMKKPRNWQETDSAVRGHQENVRRKSEDDRNDGKALNSGISVTNDSRRSILECDVNPYLLVKKQMRDEDDLSDDLSDNALEHDERSSSSLFDPSKVKSIERLPNRSAVAAIGGQRIRVFNEPREISDEDDETVNGGTITRIPISKISPKRPPRRVKESRMTLKSILKRGKADGKRKNVLFNVNNVIFAPEKPPEVALTSGRRSSRISMNSLRKDDPSEISGDIEAPIVPEEQITERPKFITIPNIRDPRRTSRVQQETKIVPEVKINSTNDRIKLDQSTIVRRSDAPLRNLSKRNSSIDKIIGDTTSSEDTRSLTDSTITDVSIDLACFTDKNATKRDASDEDIREEDKTRVSSSETSLDTIRPEDETELEIEIEELEDKITGIENEDRELIFKTGDDSNARKSSCLARSQSDRTCIRPELTAACINYSDTMRLSLRRKITAENIASMKILNEPRIAVPETDDKNEKSAMPEQRKNFAERTTEISTIAEQPKSPKFVKKDAEPARRCELMRNHENFRRMRPTSWSPPPAAKPKHSSRERISDPGLSSEPKNHRDVRASMPKSLFLDSTEMTNFENSRSPKSSSSFGSSSRIEITNDAPKSNVCKITVSPRASPLVHRLRIVGSEISAVSRATSIMINGDQSSTFGESGPSNGDNKVTISVGGEDSVCNSTVISVNSSIIPKIQSTTENRTLVILDNYRSNIVHENSARNDEPKDSSLADENEDRNDDTSCRKTDNFMIISTDNSSTERFDKSSKFRQLDERENSRFSIFNEREAGNFLKNQPKSRYREIDGAEWSSLSRESLISKLLEDSLRKARENGEVIDESSGEAILRILKQSLLKSKDYESSESTIEPEAASTYSRSPSMNSDTDFVSTNLFLDENPYEIIKEPIYEEIPDEPPPLPLTSPPNDDDYIKERIYYGEGYKKNEAYYKKVNAGQFLRSYMDDDAFKKRNDFEKTDVIGSYVTAGETKDFFQKVGTTKDGNLTSKFEFLNFLMDTKERVVTVGDEDDDEDDVDDDDGDVDEDEDDDDDDDDDDEEDEEDTEGDLEALYEQKETSMGDLSSKSSQISNVSDSSEECNIILTSSPEALKTRTVDIERTDSGVGSESSQASSSRGIARRWRTGNVSSGPGSLLCEIPQVISGDTKLCEDCEQRLEPLITDSGVVYAPFVCRKCSKKRAERKEIITEIVETEQKYGRDLQIILEEFHRPMLRAGLLTQEQLSAIFLNVEELLEHNLALAEKLKDAVDFGQLSGDEDLVTLDVGKIFLESERMLHAFESYCTRQGGASLLLQNLEKEKELLRIFLKVSQMENTVLRRMNLNSFLMVPVQRVTKYPLLLARLLKATPSVRNDVQETRKRLEQARANIELHLEHMNAEAKDVTSTRLWRRISIIQNGRRSNGEQDMVNIKLRKMAVEVLEWAHEEARFVLEGRLLVAQPTDNNWRRGRTVKLAPVTAMLVTNGKPSTEFLDSNDDSLFPRQIGIKEATLLLVKEKIGRYSLLREPLYLDKCIVCCETDLEDYFEIQELSSKETFIFKAEDGARTKRWCRTLQAHAQSLGAWRRRRGALPNIMICGVARS